MEPCFKIMDPYGQRQDENFFFLRRDLSGWKDYGWYFCLQKSEYWGYKSICATFKTKHVSEISDSQPILAASTEFGTWGDGGRCDTEAKGGKRLFPLLSLSPCNVCPLPELGWKESELIQRHVQWGTAQKCPQDGDTGFLSEWRR